MESKWRGVLNQVNSFKNTAVMKIKVRKENNKNQEKKFIRKNKQKNKIVSVLEMSDYKRKL